MITRREILSGAAALGGAAIVGGVSGLGDSLARGDNSTLTALPSSSPASPPQTQLLPPGEGGRDYTPVLTPNGVTLEHRVVDGVKVYHLIAEPIEHEFAPGLRAHLWGYNGRSPGPTIEAVTGDRVRIYVTNKIAEPTTVHWHGLRVPNGMDGVNGLTQEPIPVGATFKYEFTLRDVGTFMYHAHYDEMTQQAMGMMGLFVVHSRQPAGERVHRDYAIMLSEWRIIPGTSRPVTTEMVDFNLFTMNGKVYPATQPLLAQLGQRVRIRLGNLSAMDHHPIHLHGLQMMVTEMDGCLVPPTARYPVNTILVPVGTTRGLELTADVPGDWVLHCHMTHHTMNQMGHGAPNIVGADLRQTGRQVQRLIPGYMTMGENGMGDMIDMKMPVPANSIPMLGGKGPFGPIDMGGMFTMIKVREHINGEEDPGDYHHPPGTVAVAATEGEMKRDGIR